MPSQLEEAALRFRSQLLRQERAAASEMVQAYAAAWQRTRARLAELQEQIDAARRAGLIPGPFTPRQPGGPVIEQAPGTFSLSWLYERDRLTALLRQMEAELRQFGALAGELTEAGQLQAVRAAQGNAETLVNTALRRAQGPEAVGLFNRLSREAVQDLVGFAADGSPLRELFEALGPRVSRGVQDALVTAVATGIGPRETARLVRQQFGMGLNRALTIARTEQIRAYREASRRSYAENADLLDGWVWLSARDSRTCVSCWAMHGSRHPVTETLDDHPNGRCTMVPIVKGHDPNIPTGEDLFKELPPAQQRSILGPAAHEAWLDGRVSLAPDGRNSVVGQHDDPRWGTMRYARSLQDIVGQRDAKEYVSLALREARLSTNETDRLVRRLIRSGRAATAQDDQQIAAQIAGRVAQAPFNTRVVPAGDLSNTSYLGRTTKEQDNSDWVHLVERVTQKQWADGTTVEEYVADLRQAALAAGNVVLSNQRGGNIVALSVATNDIIPSIRRGSDSLPHLVVIYLADRGIIISGYQASDLSEVRIPTDALWLRR